MRLSARAVAGAGAVAFALGNVGRIPSAALGGRSTPLVAADLAVALVWAFLCLALAAGAVRPLVDRVATAAAAFIGVALLSTALAFSRYRLGATDGFGVLAFLVRWVAYFGWYLFPLWCLTRDESRAAWRDIERAILAIAVFGIAQSAFLPGFAQIVHDGSGMPTWDVQGRRLVSTLLDPNFAGILIVVGIVARLARIAEGMRERALPLVVLAVALLLTVSRSAIAALIVALVVIAFARGLKLALFRVIAVGVVLVLPFLSLLISFAAGFNKLGYDASAAQRLIPWTRAIRLLLEHPWLGVGFNAVQQAQEAHGWRPVGGADVSLDGGLLFVAAMTGLIGLWLYVRILWRVWRSARRAWRDRGAPPEHRAHAVASAAVLAAVVVHSLFVNSLLLPFVMQVLWVMWARLEHIAAARRVRLGIPQPVPVAEPGVGAPA
jgi:O-antigen ligase